MKKIVMLGALILGLVAGNANATYKHKDLSFATKSATCAKCHEKEYNEWRFAAGSDLPTVGFGSGHAITNTDANYVSIIDRPQVAPIKPYCQGCHEGKDAWGVADQWNKIPAISPLNKEEGTNCLTCHIDGKTGTLVPNNLLKDVTRLCATCHNEDTGMTDLVNEWKTNYIGGGATKTCLDCHMPNSNHVMAGFNSNAMRRKALTISKPMLPAIVSAGGVFDINYTVANTGVGHSMPEDLFRLLRARISIVDAAGVEVFSNEVVYYKKKTMLGEVQADTDVIKALETKHVTVPNVIIPLPGTYTVKLELLQNSNRVFVDRNETYPMGATFTTIVVQ